MYYKWCKIIPKSSDFPPAGCPSSRGVGFFPPVDAAGLPRLEPRSGPPAKLRDFPGGGNPSLPRSYIYVYIYIGDTYIYIYWLVVYLPLWKIWKSNGEGYPIRGLFKITVPENCPYAALSRTFRALSRPSRIGTWDYDRVFVWKFVTKIYRRIVFKNITYWRSVFKAALVTFLLCVMSLFQSTESMALGKSVFLWGRLTSGLDIGFAPILWKAFEVATLQKELAHFGPGLGPGQSPFANLSRTFREPFADFSSKEWNFRSFMKILWSPPVK